MGGGVGGGYLGVNGSSSDAAPVECRLKVGVCIGPEMVNPRTPLPFRRLDEEVDASDGGRSWSFFSRLDLCFGLLRARNKPGLLSLGVNPAIPPLSLAIESGAGCLCC